MAGSADRAKEHRFGPQHALGGFTQSTQPNAGAPYQDLD
jgi:hypothetical protein